MLMFLSVVFRFTVSVNVPVCRAHEEIRGERGESSGKDENSSVEKRDTAATMKSPAEQ